MKKRPLQLKSIDLVLSLLVSCPAMVLSKIVFMESIDFEITSGSSPQPTTPRDSELACPDEVRAKGGLSSPPSIADRRR